MGKLNGSRPVLSSYQKEVLDGCMLGDGNLQLKSRYPTYQHGCGDIFSSKEFLVWLFKELGFYSTSKFYDYDTEIKGYGKYKTHHANTKIIPSLLDEYYRWYPNSTKKQIIPKDLRLTKTSMLHWYLGDGHYARHNGENITFSTDCFDKESVEFIAKQLMSILDDCTGVMVYEHKKGKYRIRLQRITAYKFMKFIYPDEMPPSMKYKFRDMNELNLLIKSICKHCKSYIAFVTPYCPTCRLRSHIEPEEYSIDGVPFHKIKQKDTGMTKYIYRSY